MIQMRVMKINNNTLLDNSHMIIGKNKLNVGQINNIEFSQGNKNPTYRNTIKRIVNFDSVFRSIIIL